MNIIKLEVEGASEEQIEKYAEIFNVLLMKGALDGMRNGGATIHFGPQCEFVGVEMKYWPWRKRERGN